MQRLVQIFLSSLDDFRVQIPRGDLVPALQHSGGIAQRRHHMQQDDLGMEMASQIRGLMNHAQREFEKSTGRRIFFIGISILEFHARGIVHLAALCSPLTVRRGLACEAWIARCGKAHSVAILK